MAARKKKLSSVIAGPTFVVLAASTVGAAVAPSMGQSPIVGAFTAGFIVMLVQVYM